MVLYPLLAAGQFCHAVRIVPKVLIRTQHISHDIQKQSFAEEQSDNGPNVKCALHITVPIGTLVYATLFDRPQDKAPRGCNSLSLQISEQI